jgi:hypothetical protein
MEGSTVLTPSVGEFHVVMVGPVGVVTSVVVDIGW